MRSALRTLPFLLCLSASAADPAAVLATTRQVWPDSGRFAIVCDYGWSHDAIEDAAKAAGANGYQTLTVVDVRDRDNLNKAASYLASHKAPFVLLLPKDPIAGDGTFGATLLMARLDHYGVPAVSTHRIALKQGALMAQGDDTNGLLLINNNLNSVFDYTLLPAPLKPATSGRLVAPASIQMISFR